VAVLARLVARVGRVLGRAATPAIVAAVEKAAKAVIVLDMLG
jgi:hypothetical protein